VLVAGTVQARRPGNENPELPTGEIGSPRRRRVLAESDPLPFPIESGAEVSEKVRLKYGNLDIRRPTMAAALLRPVRRSVPHRRR